MVSRCKMVPDLCVLLSLQKQNGVCAQVNMNTLTVVNVYIRIHILMFENTRNTDFEPPRTLPSSLMNGRLFLESSGLRF
jgi:hypothetical protein